MHKKAGEIFRKGSRTYYYSSVFFPENIRREVFSLYAFVRTADDLVDCIPPMSREFEEFKRQVKKTFSGGIGDNPVINDFFHLSKTKGFESDWVTAFLKSMEADLKIKNYATMDELEEYMYGSAEVVGLMMSKILSLGKDSYPFAMALGKAMQYVNFIRDIEEDNKLGRAYLPLSDRKKHGLGKLTRTEASKKQENFIAFIREQVEKYRKMLLYAKKGFGYIPKKYLIPIKTASDMYEWTAGEIEKNPFVVYERKVKPGHARIAMRVFYNLMFI